MKWTAEHERELVYLYKNNLALKEIAERFQCREAEVRQKLVSLKVYNKAKPAQPEFKAELISLLARKLACEEIELESLEKASKTCLKLLLRALIIEKP